MKYGLFFNTKNFIWCLILMLALTFTPAFYSCLVNEYNYNLLIDRGFVSRNAIYFIFTSVLPDSESADSESGNCLNDITSFSDDASFFLATMNGIIRGVYYQGNEINLPEMQSGHFFTQEECVSEEKLAVVGKDYRDSLYKKPNSSDEYIQINGVEYRVLGVMGLDKTTTIDGLIFVNLGSSSEEEIVSNLMYIDSEKKDTAGLFQNLRETVQHDSKYALDTIEMENSATDVVFGGVLFSELLKYVIYFFLAFSFICVLNFVVRSDNFKISVLLLHGYSYSKILSLLSAPVILSGLCGIALGDILGTALFAGGFFAVPSSQIVGSFVLSSIFTLLCLMLFPVLQYIYIRRNNIPDCMR